MPLITERAYTARKDMKPAETEARIRVRLTPRAARDEVVGWRDGVVFARVTAPPIEGRANVALERLLADALGVPKSRVRVASGARGREKTIAVDGISQEEADRRLRDAGPN